MNKVILMGRLVKNPDGKFVQVGQEQIAIAQYTLAVNRKQTKGQEQQADFITCKAFRSNAEFASKYLFKGTKVAVVGRLQTGSYTNKEGQKVYTTEVIVEEHHFAESKSASNTNNQANQSGDITGSFQSFEQDEELPFQ